MRSRIAAVLRRLAQRIDPPPTITVDLKFTDRLSPALRRAQAPLDALVRDEGIGGRG